MVSLLNYTECTLYGHRILSLSIQYSVFSGKIRAEPEAHAKLAEALDWFSDMVEATGYAAGTDHLTLADLRSEICPFIER